PSAALAALLATAATEAAVPLPLLAGTVRAASWFASEQAGGAGLVSARAVALARGVCRAMFVNKLKIAAAALLAVAMLGTGATLLLKPAPAAPPAPAAEQPPPGARPDRAEAPGERLPEGALARPGTTHLRHGDAVSYASYAPDGRGLLTVDRSKTVRLWALAAGKEIRRFDWGGAGNVGKPENAEDGEAQRREQQFWDDTARSCSAALSADGTVVAASR